VTFNEVLSQTIAMLQQHARVSYRALKRQVARDNAFLPEYHVALKYSAACTRLKELELDVCRPNLYGLSIIINRLRVLLIGITS